MISLFYVAMELIYVVIVSTLYTLLSITQVTRGSLKKSQNNQEFLAGFGISFGLRLIDALLPTS